jgi:cytochrome c-type biogenesis protein
MCSGWPSRSGGHRASARSSARSCRIAATEANLDPRHGALLGVYALGLGIPFLLVAAFIDRAMAVMGRLKRHMKTIERAMGLLLVAVGGALITGAFSAFAFWLLETFPALALLG